MNDLEREKMHKAFLSYKKKVTRSKKAARKFLIELGVYTEKGNLRKPYKNLKMPS
jgi:hypothetical protein